MKPLMDPPVPAVTFQELRRLEWNERVRRGDFVEDGRQGYEPWDGPAGFQADSFNKAIYRKRESHPVAPEKAS